MTILTSIFHFVPFSPLIPFGQQIPPSVIYALLRWGSLHYFVVQLFLLCYFFWKYVCFLCHLREDFITSDAEQQPTHFTVGVQTDYRESETQTDPYSPEYVIQPGTTPSELLQMAALTWGIGVFIVFFICYMNRDGTLMSNFIRSWHYNYLALFSPSYFFFLLTKHNL